MMNKITVSIEMCIDGNTNHRDYILWMDEDTSAEDLQDWKEELTEFLEALEDDECNDAHGPAAPRVMAEVDRMLTGLSHKWKMPPASIYHNLPGYDNEMTVWVKGERHD